MQKNEKLRKGRDYYSGLEMKINEVLNASKKFIQQREIEKEALIQSITRMSYNQFMNNQRRGNINQGAFSNAYESQDAFLDPNNIYTQLGAKGYQYEEKKNNNKNTGFNNQMMNNNMNNNNMNNQNPHPYRTQLFNNNNNQNMGQGFNPNNNFPH